MSMTLTLVPLAIALNVSLASSVAAILCKQKPEGASLPAVETIFSDAALLEQTLREHGLSFTAASPNEYTVSTDAGVLRYFRASADVPFQLEATGVDDMEELLDSLDALENEYGRNVQKFTYDKVMCSLAQYGMTVDREEVLEDDSILLTLNL